MATSPRPELAAVPACPHGSIGGAELAAWGMRSVLDFSVNCNPLGPPSAVAAALAAVDPARYPDDECGALRRALAPRLGVAEDCLVVGNGSVELIWLLAAAYLRPGDAALIVGPTFGEYARAVAIHGGRPLEHRASAEDGFRPRVGEIVARLRDLRPRLVFLCNPNNPTGVYLGRAEVGRLSAACTDGLLVVDEAYLAFVERADSLLDLLDEGVVLLRSLTKDYALAGLRLGYALAAPAVSAALRQVRAPWSVNAAAQAAGLAALADEAHLARARQEVAAARAYLMAELTSLGLPVLPSAANFLLVRVGAASKLRGELLRRGCCVRDCTSFGLPEYIRIGLRRLPECRQLVAALREVLHDG